MPSHYDAMFGHYVAKEAKAAKKQAKLKNIKRLSRNA